MNTKIVYVLVSSEADFYFEMLQLSLCSLRLYHPKEDTEVVVAMDRDTYLRLVNKASFIDDITPIIPVIPQGYTTMQRSRYLKTKLRELVVGDFLYLDIDTIVCRPLNEADYFKGDICAVLDNHKGQIPSNQLEGLPSGLKKWKKLKGTTAFNSGVVYSKDTKDARCFFRLWHELWKYTSTQGCNYDQVSLRKTVQESEIEVQELDGRWNCQVICESSIDYRKDAKVIHYFHFKEPLFAILSKNCLMKIRKDGEVPEECVEQLKLSNSLFDTISVSTDYYLIRKKVLRQFWDIYCDYPHFFVFLEHISSIYKKVVACLWRLRQWIR